MTTDFVRTRLTRRDFLTALAASAVSTRFASRPAAWSPEDPPRMSMGVCAYSFGYRRPKSAYEFLEYCHELGAGGVQIGLDSLEPESTQKLRRRAEQLEMYLEVIADLPADDPSG